VIELDFENDLKHIVQGELSALGYPQEGDLDSVLVRYLNIKHRLPPVVPWGIHISEQLKAKELPLEIREGLKLFIERAKAGEDLKPYMSTRILDADFPDLMFYDWGIHHFHLGKESNARGFIERTDELLFAITDPNGRIMYLIDVISHHGSFTSQDLLRIIEENWPSVLDPYVLKGVAPSFDGLSNGELEKLRKAGINLVLQIPRGRTLAPIGGGISTAKTSIYVRIKADGVKCVVHRLQQHLEDQAEKIEEYFAKEHGLRSEELDVRMTSYGQPTKIVELKTGVVLFEGQL